MINESDSDRIKPSKKRGQGPKDTITMACNFLEEAKNLPAKYEKNELAEFMAQYEELDVGDKYTCCEMMLSHAWSAVALHKFIDAQKELALVLPLCQKDRLDFPEFEIDKLMWECWINNPNLNDEERQDNIVLLEECGLKFDKMRRGRGASKKTGFLQSLRNFCCCVRG